MKSLIFSDLHIHPWNAFSKLNNQGINSRLAHTIDCLYEILTIAKDRNVDSIFFCGDLFHTQKISVEVYDLAARALYDLTDEFQVFSIPGNHDEAGKFQDLHSLTAFRKSLTLLDPEKPIKIGSHKIAGIPYLERKEDLIKTTKKLKKKDLDVLLIHSGFAGLKAGFEYIADFTEHLDPLELYGSARMIFSGHFHDPQICRKRTIELVEDEQTINTKNEESLLVVPGAPLQHTFSDEGSIRGCWEYDLDKSKLEFIPILKFPMFFRLSHDELEDDFIEGNFLKVTVPSNLKKTELENLQEKLKPAEGYSLEFFDTERRTIKRENGIEIKPFMGQKEILKRYVKSSKTNLESKKLVSLGLNLIKKAIVDE